jgi:hypothetical protein
MDRHTFIKDENKHPLRAPSQTQMALVSQPSRHYLADSLLIHVLCKFVREDYEAVASILVTKKCPQLKGSLLPQSIVVDKMGVHGATKGC